MIDTLMSYDRAIGDAAAALRNSAAMKIIGPASDIADQWQLFAICAATGGWGALYRKRKLVQTGVNMAVAMLAATVLKNLIKSHVDRTRPEVVARGGQYIFQPGKHDVPDLDSFPSGHTAGAVAVALAIADQYPSTKLIAFGAAASVAAVQVPRAKHYPIDLVAGCIIGLVAQAAARRVLRIALSLDCQNRLSLCRTAKLPPVDGSPSWTIGHKPR